VTNCARRVQGIIGAHLPNIRHHPRSMSHYSHAGYNFIDMGTSYLLSCGASTFTQGFKSRRHENPPSIILVTVFYGETHQRNYGYIQCPTMLSPNAEYVQCDPSFHFKIQMTTQDHGESFTSDAERRPWNNNQERPSANLFSGHTDSMSHFTPLHFLDIDNASCRMGMLHPKPNIDVDYPHYQPAKGTPNKAAATNAPQGDVHKLMIDSIASGVDIKIDGLSAIAGINCANGIHRIWVMSSAHEHELPLSSIEPTISTPSPKEHSVPANIQSMLHSFETKCTPMLMLIPHPILGDYELNGFTGFLIPSSTPLPTAKFDRFRFDPGSHADKSLSDLFSIRTMERDMSQITDPLCHNAINAQPAPQHPPPGEHGSVVDATIDGRAETDNAVVRFCSVFGAPSSHETLHLASQDHGESFTELSAARMVVDSPNATGAMRFDRTTDSSLRFLPALENNVLPTMDVLPVSTANTSTKIFISSTTNARLTCTSPKMYNVKSPNLSFTAGIKTCEKFIVLSTAQSANELLPPSNDEWNNVFCSSPDNVSSESGIDNNQKSPCDILENSSTTPSNGPSLTPSEAIKPFAITHPDHPREDIADDDDEAILSLFPGLAEFVSSLQSELEDSIARLFTSNAEDPSFTLIASRDLMNRHPEAESTSPSPKTNLVIDGSPSGKASNSRVLMGSLDLSRLCSLQLATPSDANATVLPYDRGPVMLLAPSNGSLKSLPYDRGPGLSVTVLQVVTGFIFHISEICSFLSFKSTSCFASQVPRMFSSLMLRQDICGLLIGLALCLFLQNNPKVLNESIRRFPTLIQEICLSLHVLRFRKGHEMMGSDKIYTAIRTHKCSLSVCHLTPTTKGHEMMGSDKIFTAIRAYGYGLVSIRTYEYGLAVCHLYLLPLY